MDSILDSTWGHGRFCERQLQAIIHCTALIKEWINLLHGGGTSGTVAYSKHICGVREIFLLRVKSKGGTNAQTSLTREKI